MRAGPGIMPAHVPDGVTELGDGIARGGGPVGVDVYFDYQCPFCKQFELTTGPTLDGLVEDRMITLVHHPVAFLDAASTDRYSSRASSASGCAADQGRFAEYTYALFAAQPPEGGPGLPDDELARLGESVGVTEPAFGICVRRHTYLDWAAYVTAVAIRQGVNATPTVYVEGVSVPANTQMIVAAVASLSPGPR
ncbi:thioredoxin domain-containing protein [Sphaerisporangium sp. TRM90804]|uniref:DsbA family protein n=1 Tax=Sphaerisporangium sp. TRM90804 TaxID=3031113 RepID=UPI002448A7DC|nr:thioredoxin domain-containing protein [Sphaerisporangium sp. TRM90804]MDH2426584.1 thioredoxin domain-containing protein [Sphaerisporangium sp. TRM90804]